MDKLNALKAENKVERNSLRRQSEHSLRVKKTQEELDDKEDKVFIFFNFFFLFFFALPSFRGLACLDFCQACVLISVHGNEERIVLFSLFDVFCSFFFFFSLRSLSLVFLFCSALV